MDIFGIEEFAKEIDKLYASIRAMLESPMSSFAVPSWVANLFNDVGGFAIGILICVAIALVLMLPILTMFNLDSPRQALYVFGVVILLNAGFSVIGWLLFELIPSFMPVVLDFVGAKGLPPVTAGTGDSPLIGTLFITIMAYGAVGSILNAELILLPYLLWIASTLLLVGIALIWLKGIGQRLMRFSLYTVITTGILGYPLLYWLYGASIESGNDNGIPTSGWGFLLMLAAVLIVPAIIIAAVGIDVIVKNRSGSGGGPSSPPKHGNTDVDNTVKTKTDIEDGDIDATIDNPVTLVDGQQDGGADVPSTALDAIQRGESKDDTSLNPASPSSPSPISDKLTAAAPVVAAAGHPEIALAMKIAANQFDTPTRRVERQNAGEND